MSLDATIYVEVDTGGKESLEMVIYSCNITHNLNKMAMEAGIYEELWHPESIKAEYAKDIIEPVEEGLKKLIAKPEHFEKFNSPNGWGSYKHFVPFVEEYLKELKKHPKARIKTGT